MMISETRGAGVFGAHDTGKDQWRDRTASKPAVLNVPERTVGQ